MTAQEQELLQGLVDRVSKTQLAEKDSDAENMLQNSLGKNPDALYILAQTVLVQQYALEQAQRQLAQAQQQMNDLRTQNQQLQQQAQQPKHTSFLGSLLGRDDDPPRQAPAPPPPPPPAVQGQSSQGQYAPVPSYPQQSYPQQGYPQQGGFGQPAGYGGGFGAPQGGGFLRSALQTATGVAAGALAFQGVESLMHGFGHAAGYGSEFGPALGGGFGQSGPREEVINNYYGDSKPDGGAGDHSNSFLPDFNNSSSDTGTSSFTRSHDGSRDLSSADGTADMGRDYGDSSSRDFVETTDATSNDTLSGFDNSGSGYGSADNDTDDSGLGPDDSGSGFDDSGSDFDSDSGGGFDDSSSSGDGF